MVIGHHLIMTAYGWWLPNDPRGSTSHYIASDIIADLGQLHFGRKRIQPASRDIRAFYENAAGVLKHELLTFDDSSLSCVADAFSQCIDRRRYTCYACAIMPDHAHILIRKHKHQAERMIEQLQLASAVLLRSCGLRPPEHPVWALGGWKVFPDHPDAIRRTISYIELNPPKMKHPVQRWSFVKQYDDWPLCEGHDPNSPYARAIGKHR